MFIIFNCLFILSPVSFNHKKLLVETEAVNQTKNSCKLYSDTVTGGSTESPVTFRRVLQERKYSFSLLASRFVRGINNSCQMANILVNNIPNSQQTLSLLRLCAGRSKVNVCCGTTQHPIQIFRIFLQAKIALKLSSKHGYTILIKTQLNYFYLWLNAPFFSPR